MLKEAAQQEGFEITPAIGHQDHKYFFPHGPINDAVRVGDEFPEFFGTQCEQFKLMSAPQRQTGQAGGPAFKLAKCCRSLIRPCQQGQGLCQSLQIPGRVLSVTDLKGHELPQSGPWRGGKPQPRGPLRPL